VRKVVGKGSEGKGRGRVRRVRKGRRVGSGADMMKWERVVQGGTRVWFEM